ncbi:MAG: hypothetical protein JW870_13480 [Candidatus Delongbacteria bacterium]|nr:hypothetical protein [Candidatus Delongbacteria bacterium]
MEFVTDINYLFYILKWILKQDFIDLSYSVFMQDIMDPEYRPETLIKNEWCPILQERYFEQLQKDFQEIYYDWTDKTVIDSIEEGIVVIF